MALSQDVFKHAATKEDQCWSTKQYRDDEQRVNLMNSTNRGAQSNIDPEISEKLRTSKHNIQTTIISEYSNA